MTDDVHTPGVADRYVAKFGEMPSTILWEDAPQKLDALMEAAIKNGRKLTDADLARAQGRRPLPPGAIA